LVTRTRAGPGAPWPARGPPPRPQRGRRRLGRDV